MAINLTPPPVERLMFRADRMTLDWREWFIRTFRTIDTDAAPADARYVVTTPNAALTNGFNLGALASGYLKLTTALGIGTPSTVASIPAADVSSGAALTRVNDTNVTITLGGTPASTLLRAVTLTLGWQNVLGLGRGGTFADLSATGGASQVLRQSSAGAAVTVGQLASSDLSDASALPLIRANGRVITQTGAVASIAAYTVGAADATFYVSANVNVTVSTTHNFTIAVDYTDETSTARTLTLTFSQVAGTFLTAITNVTGAGPYDGLPLHIRCKTATTITVKSTGTFTTVTYNAEARITEYP